MKKVSIQLKINDIGMGWLAGRAFIGAKEKSRLFTVEGKTKESIEEIMRKQISEFAEINPELIIFTY